MLPNVRQPITFSLCAVERGNCPKYPPVTKILSRIAFRARRTPLLWRDIRPKRRGLTVGLHELGDRFHLKWSYSLIIGIFDVPRIGCEDNKGSRMKTKKEILGILQQEKPDLARRYGVKRLALFGSYARDDQREDSDVDILVEVDPSIGLGFVELADRIEGALGVRVEVVSRRAIKPRYWEMIEKELIDVA